MACTGFFGACGGICGLSRGVGAACVGIARFYGFIDIYNIIIYACVRAGVARDVCVHHVRAGAPGGMRARARPWWRYPHLRFAKFFLKNFSGEHGGRGLTRRLGCGIM